MALVKAAEEAESFHLDHAEPTGPLIIEASSSVSIGILPKLLLKFQKRYPGIRLTIKTSDDVDVTINGVSQNRLDFAFIMHLREDFPGCRKAMEKKIEFAFVAPATDPLTKEENVPLQRIFDGKFYQSFIASDKEVSLGSDLAWVLEKKEIQIQPAMEFGSTAAIVHLLLEGEGRSFLPRFMVEKEIEQGRLAVIPTEEIDVDIWSQVYYNENKWINPQMRAFIDFIKEELEIEKKKEE